MLMRGSSERKAETSVHSNERTIIRSNSDRLRPKLLVATVRMSQPIQAMATPIDPPATE